VDASRDAKPTAGTKSEIAGRLRSIAKIVIIDIAAPLIAYNLLRSAGMSTVTALVLTEPLSDRAAGSPGHHRHWRRGGLLERGRPRACVQARIVVTECLASPQP
jgi:hypothetical protein